MKKHVLMMPLLGCLSLPSVASDFYLLADIGTTNASGFEDYDSDSKIAYSLGGGYQLNSSFAIEVAYRELGSWSEEPFFEGDTVDEKLEFSAIQASVLGSLPINESLSAYGRIGIAELEMEVISVGIDSKSLSKTKAVVGAGVDYAITPALSLRSEYLRYAEVYHLDVSTLSLGLTYQF
jgi:OOP family OmpA-OmpF porin